MKDHLPLPEQAEEIYKRYEGLSLQEKIDVIAKTFGAKTGVIHTSPCTGKWRGTSDMTLQFDNGVSYFIGNHLTPKTKTVKVRTECVNTTLKWNNPEIVEATKEAALPMLLWREVKDNEIAAQKGLKPYKVLNVEFINSGDQYLGWYYVTLAVGEKILAHIETTLFHEISDGKVRDTPSRSNYYPAGALEETDVDFVFNSVGFSTKSTLYTLPLSEDVRKRAEETLARRMKQERDRDPEAQETGETVRTPRGTFYVTDMSREDMEAAGYGYHHQSEDGRHLIMTNGTRAFAISSGISQENTQLEKMTVLVVEPGRKPYRKDMEPGLRSLQAAVGGPIEAVYPYEDHVALVCNEEGKLRRLPYNRALRDADGQIYDVVVGTFLIVGLGEENFTSLTPEQLSKYEEQFQTPEGFINLGGKLMSFPYEGYDTVREDSFELDQEDDLEL